MGARHSNLDPLRPLKKRLRTLTLTSALWACGLALGYALWVLAAQTVPGAALLLAALFLCLMLIAAPAVVLGTSYQAVILSRMTKGLRTVSVRGDMTNWWVGSVLHFIAGLWIWWNFVAPVWEELSRLWHCHPPSGWSASWMAFLLTWAPATALWTGSVRAAHRRLSANAASPSPATAH